MRKKITVGGLLLCLSLAFLGGNSGLAASKLVSFDTPEQEQLYKLLLEEYRCLKCQNQNLADSNAALAGDLRNEIRDQVVAGRNRSEINEYLVARYGDFVLYKPQLKPSTYILWFGPFLLLIAAGWYAVGVARRHRTINSSTNSAMDSSKADEVRSLLDD